VQDIRNEMETVIKIDDKFQEAPYLGSVVFTKGAAVLAATRRKQLIKKKALNHTKQLANEVLPCEAYHLKIEMLKQ
jgi:hypothetical protein